MDCSGFVSRAFAPVAALGLFLAAGPALAADVTGLWATPVHGGQVEIAKCGASVCGRIVTSDGIKADPGLKDTKNSDASKRDRALKGQQILGGFSGGPTEWSGGQIYNAEDGKTYSASLTLDGDNTLKVRGCIVVPLCQTQTWTRVR
ncbi:hypothetical protein GCM10007301_19120 [Azorhizobium oxalatiphilum]|uniref:DUF2147 domain-containing protein n=1 Tax=Azorhizobium oxalatiphilum TaxID=980631 RepID=A0A917FAC1_9HYPH|nr:DUF2147 domain-containing protein [Azorhizobium oxalatiphilum]GGF59546.1 hypothetical protein GCM10007301_19120 [Azorhizobium oxalatiphilum]